MNKMIGPISTELIHLMGLPVNVKKYDDMVELTFDLLSSTETEAVLQYIKNTMPDAIIGPETMEELVQFSGGDVIIRSLD